MKADFISLCHLPDPLYFLRFYVFRICIYEFFFASFASFCSIVF